MARHRRSALLVVAAAALAYGVSLKNGFVWDDRVYVQENPFVAESANLAVLLDPRYYLKPQPVLGGTRPLFLASLMVDRLIWEERPAGYHLTNLVLHAANGLWVLAIGAALAPAAALGAGLLFVVHPATSEAVNAVSFRSDLLAAFFTLASLWAFLKSRAGAKPSRWIAASAGLLGLGVLSKEMAASVPLLAGLIELYFPEPRDRRRRLAAAAASYGLVAVLFGAFWSARFRYQWDPAAVARGPEAPAGPGVSRAVAPPPSTIGGGPEGTLLTAAPRAGAIFAPSAPPWSSLRNDAALRARTMAAACGDYLRLLIWPHPLVVDRAPRIIAGWAEPWAWSRWLLLLSAVAAAAWGLRSFPAAGLGGAWFLAALLPVAGIAPLYNPVAERYLYLPTAGFSLAAAALWARAAGRLGPVFRPGIFGLGVVILSVCAGRTAARSTEWFDEDSLFLSEAEGELQSPRIHFQRGLALRRQGRAALAAAEFEEAVRRQPEFSEAWLSLGMSYASAGDARAAAAAARAIVLSPGNPVFRFGNALVLAGAGRHEAAEREYRQAVALEPRYLEAWVNLAALLKGQGRLKEAASCYERAIRLEPRDALPFIALAAMLESSGSSRSRLAALYRDALIREPAHPLAARRLAALEGRTGRKGKNR